MRAKEFIPGERIGAWEIVGPSKTDEYGHRLWLCHCTLCGKEAYVEGTKLRRGKSTSCGCDRKEKIAAKATPATEPKENLRGRVFGALTVLDDPPKKSSTNHWEWKCRCNVCGTEKYFRATKLRSGEVTSCGCQRGIKKFGAEFENEEVAISVYDIIPEIWCCDDLIDCAQLLLEFVKAASKETNKALVLRRFYEDLSINAATPVMENFIFGKENKKWHVIDGSAAVTSYLHMTIPQKTSPVKTLKDIENYAYDLLENFSNSPREPIGRSIVEDILRYLDEKYNFSDLVFRVGAAKLIILNVENKDADSAFLVMGNSMITLPVFLLCANHEDCKQNQVEVFFHELGHAIHYAITGKLDIFPSAVLKILADTCFPNIESLPVEDRQEVLADVFGIGLMYNTPYIEYDTAHYMLSEDKVFFACLVERLLEALKKRSEQTGS